MKNEEFRGRHRDGHHRGEGHKRKDHDFPHRGAKTFRRGKALVFLEMMNVKRSTLRQQLEAPEYQSINQILVGELKAIDMIISEFVQLFELHEFELIKSEGKTEEEENALEAEEESQENE